MVRWLVGLGLMVAAGGMVALPLSCSRAADRTVTDRALVVGVEELEYYPFFAVRDGDYVGAAREILDAFARDAGYRISYRPLPIKRLVVETLNGDLDARFPDNPTWAAEAKAGRRLVYSKPVLTFTDGVMVRPSQMGRRPEDVRILATIAGFTPQPWQPRIAAGQVVMAQSPRIDGLLREAVVGHADGAYVNVEAAEHALTMGLGMPGALQYNPALPHVTAAYHLSSARHPELVARFDAWLSANAALVERVCASFAIAAPAAPAIAAPSAP